MQCVLECILAFSGEHIDFFGRPVSMLLRAAFGITLLAEAILQAIGGRALHIDHPFEVMLYKFVDLIAMLALCFQ